MAASLSIKKIVPLLSALSLSQTQQIRLKSRGLFPRRRKPIQKWFDPANTSWAEPILKQQKLKATEPEPEPSLLHMVYRIRSHFTRPYWEKDILKEFELFEESYKPVVLKNTPEVNNKLKIIQHMIRIKPVTFPYGLPQDEADYHHCFLKHNGEFVVRHRIKDQNDELEQAWSQVKLAEEEAAEDIWKMDKLTIHNESKIILQRFRLSSEYFEVKHQFKYNQDGQEYRYKGVHGNNGKRQDWY